MPPTTGRLGLLVRRARPFGMLVVLALLAVPLIAAASHVEVDVDGERETMWTFASTVADVLEKLDIELEEADRVNHDLATAVDSDMVIEVARAVTVDVTVDGALEHRVIAPVSSVAEVLEQAGLSDLRAEDAIIVPQRASEVADGDVVEVWMPNTVTVSVDGDDIEVTTFADDVDLLLAQQRIELGPEDRVNVDLDASLAGVDHVVIERVGYFEEVEEVVIERGEQRRETSQLLRGNTRVDDEGADGLRVDTYRVKWVDGEPAERELVHQEVVREPQPRVVSVGTGEPPREESEESGDPPPSGPAGAPPADDPVWERLARCESGGNWSAVSPNGLYYGGLQFHPDTWRRVGGSGMPHEASREEQIYRGQRLQARSGWSPWPHCSRQLGLR